MKVREPVARPVDIVALELCLSASQAFLVGVLMYLAVGIWDDRGVGGGPVAMILALLAIAVAGGWLYWLLGGTGWPLAAADVPVGVFSAFALVLALRGEELIRIDGLILLLASAAAVYGIVCGVFLDPPRRWRWDQRQRLRPGTEVPRISWATRSLVARIPRSLPRRPDGRPTTERAGGRRRRGREAPHADGPLLETAVPASRRTAPAGRSEDGGERVAAADGAQAAIDPPDRTSATQASAREPRGPVDQTGEHQPPADTITQPSRGPRVGSPGSRGPSLPRSGPPAEPTGPIELPTSVEPRAQRSPWAWAAPPEWNRDEDDEPPAGSSRRT